ncbi:MAG: hypothetical protein Q7S86_00480 [bacterium]|nr:hypothetical protein [bacterium]
MSIRDWSEKIKGMGQNGKEMLPQGENASRYYTAAIIVLVGLSSFGLGRLSAIDDKREPVTIEDSIEIVETAPPTAAVGGAPTQSASVVSSVKGQMSIVKSSDSTPLATGGKLVASRSGTKYYFPWCGSNIAEKNKIWFNSEAEARAKGYEPAANCKGLR